MQSDIWANLNYWSEYGQFCDMPHEVEVEKELKKVKRIIIEAGKDLDEQDWLDVARQAKTLFGVETVLDIGIRKSLVGGAKVIYQGYVVESTVVSRYRKWRGYD